MEAKWSSLVSYGMSLDALKDFLPLDVTLDVKTVRYDTLKVAKRLEAELGDEQPCFIAGSPSDWDLLPPPDGSFKVGIDGGYVRNWFAKKHNFEVIVGKSTLSFIEDEEDKAPSSKRFGFVQTLDTKPKRRLYEVLQSQGLPLNFSQFVEGRRWWPWARKGLEAARVFAGAEPCHGEEIRHASARFYALQTARN
jgi:hypothetical protein